MLVRWCLKNNRSVSSQFVPYFGAWILVNNYLISTLHTTTVWRLWHLNIVRY
jgi:hypothetical protein